MSDELADAQAWYDRAQQHIAEYRSLAYGENDQTWRLRHDRGDDGRHIYSLHFNRGLFPQLKPIACEAANAMFQSLDNIIATAARQAGVPRSPQIAWPWALQPDTASNLAGAVKPAIDSRLHDMRKRGMPEAWLDLVAATFAEHAMGLVHIDVVKEVSLSGKHWELVATKANAVAIGWHLPGSAAQSFADIPADYFEAEDVFVFHEGDPIEVSQFQIVAGTKLIAPGKAHQPEPISAFGYTSRFVETTLANARMLLAT